MIRNRFTIWLAQRAVRHVVRRQTLRAPDFVVGDVMNPYMLRWWMIPRNPVFNIYLHQFLKDDDDRALHDHPWWSLSLSLSGQMQEIYLKRGVQQTREVRPGALIFRSGRFAHRMVVPMPSWTIFITGFRFRNWGFLCPQGWKPWQEFCAADNKGAIGRGCGE